MVHIGITGHRSLAQIDRLRAGIDKALEQIELAFTSDEWVVISSLAEGADRLAAHCLWRRHPRANLVVPLPLPVEKYEHDFRSEESLREFRAMLNHAVEVIQPTPTRARREAYRQAGVRMLERSDVLLALWDGKPAFSRGGTAEIVALSRQRSMPLAWVRCGNHAALGEDQGQVSFERFTVS